MYQNIMSEAGKQAAINRFQTLIDNGRRDYVSLIGRLQAEIPEDRIVSPQTFDFTVADNGQLLMAYNKGGETYALHPNALQQMFSRTNLLTKGVGDKMIEAGEWGKELLVHNLNVIHQNSDRSKVLTRTVHGQVRAVLSDKYRRFDGSLIMEKFLQKIHEYGCVPIHSHASDIKWSLKVVLPDMFEPAPNEVLLYGIAVEHSDFGAGTFSAHKFCERLVCLNGMIREEVIRKVHIGARLTEDLVFSQRTYELDSAALASATEDVVQHLLEPHQVDSVMEGIKAASQKEIDPEKELTKLHKNSKISKGEKEMLEKTFNSADVQLLPPGNTAWRLANSLSLFAQDPKNTVERRLELEKLSSMFVDEVDA